MKTEKKEQSLHEIRTIMALPSSVQIVPRELEASGVEEDTEWFGYLTDAERASYIRETGQSL